MLTLTERIKYHLKQPYTLGWDWTADALIEELTAKLQDTGLPGRLREVYTSLKLELLLCCQDTASWGDSIEDDTEDLDAEEVDAPVDTLASGRPRPVLKHQSPEEWAFKMGTLCTDTTTAPSWSSLAAHKGLGWVATATQSDQANGYSYLTQYFRLGTYCKVGTPFDLVRSTNDWRVGIQLGTVPQKTMAYRVA